MKKIEAFKTSNGKIFENKTDAENHENELRISHEIKNFVENSDFVRGDSNDLILFLIENRESLLNILN